MIQNRNQVFPQCRPYLQFHPWPFSLSFSEDESKVFQPSPLSCSQKLFRDRQNLIISQSEFLQNVLVFQKLMSEWRKSRGRTLFKYVSQTISTLFHNWLESSVEHQTFLGCPENELKKSLGLPATQTLSKEEGSERYYYLEQGYSWEIHSKNRRKIKCLLYQGTTGWSSLETPNLETWLTSKCLLSELLGSCL